MLSDAKQDATLMGSYTRKHISATDHIELLTAKLPVHHSREHHMGHLI